MAKVKLRPGDVFAFDRYDGTYGFGRLMLDIREQCVKPRALAPVSPLLMFEDALLVQLFTESSDEPEGEPSNVGINGALIAPDLLRQGFWPIIGNRPVRPEEVEFPENLRLVGIASRFTRGEVDLPLSLAEPAVDQIDAFPTRYSSTDVVNASLALSGDSNETTPIMKREDLRFKPERAAVYEELGEDPGLSYREMAKQHGYDVSRFYE